MNYREQFQQAVEAIQDAYSAATFAASQNSRRTEVQAQLKTLLLHGKALLAGDTLTPEEREAIEDIVPTRTDFALTHEYHDACEALRKFDAEIWPDKSQECHLDEAEYAKSQSLQAELDRTSSDQELRMLTVRDLAFAILDDPGFRHRGSYKDAALAFLSTEPMFDMVPEAELIASRYLFARLRALTGTQYLYAALKNREEQWEADQLAEEAETEQLIASRDDYQTNALAVSSSGDNGYTALQSRITYLYQTRDQDPKAADGELRFLSTAARLLMAASRFRMLKV